jgi:hypothetical protein
MHSGVLGFAASVAIILGGLAKASPLGIIVVAVIVLAFLLLVYRLAFSEKGRAWIKCGPLEFGVEPYDKKDNSS